MREMKITTKLEFTEEDVKELIADYVRRKFQLEGDVTIQCTTKYSDNSMGRNGTPAFKCATFTSERTNRGVIMSFDTLDDMFAHYGRLPDELKVVWERNWDETGRSTRDPLGLHLDLMHMCVESSCDDYKEKFMTIMAKDELTDKEDRMLQEYWTIFIEGGKALAHMINSRGLALTKDE